MHPVYLFFCLRFFVCLCVFFCLFVCLLVLFICLYVFPPTRSEIMETPSPFRKRYGGLIHVHAYHGTYVRMYGTTHGQHHTREYMACLILNTLHSPLLARVLDKGYVPQCTHARARFRPIEYLWSSCHINYR